MSIELKQPPIFYEESADGMSKGFPFMQIDKGNNIPSVLFIGAVTDTDERVDVESSETIKEIVMQSYFNSESLKKILDEETYNKTKVLLGLKPLKGV